MVTFTTKITPGKIEQELTFNERVLRHTWELVDNCMESRGAYLFEQITKLYPDNRGLILCVQQLELLPGQRLGDLYRIAELHAIEDEYARAKEAQNV